MSIFRILDALRRRRIPELPVLPGPLDHPSLRAMTPRQLADLPLMMRNEAQAQEAAPITPKTQIPMAAVGLSRSAAASVSPRPHESAMHKPGKPTIV